MFTYYIEFTSEEHMLYLHEIATNYGIMTVNGNPHSRIITEILNEYKSIQHTPFPKVLWGRDLKQVWPYEQYDPAMKWFLGNTKDVLIDMTSHTFQNGNTYNYRFM